MIADMRWLLLLLMLSSQIKAGEDLVIPVHTQKTLPLIKLHFPPSGPAQFSASDWQKLQATLQFDLSQSGHCNLASSNTPKEDCSYKITLSYHGHELNVLVTDLLTGRSKELSGLTLRDNLEANRQLMHRLSDTLVYHLFNKTGIASTKILYTLRTRRQESSDHWVTEVWESDYDGFSARQMTHEGHLCVTPCYLPMPSSDSKRFFFFVSYKLGQPKMYAADTSLGPAKRLSYLRGNQLMPTLSSTCDCVAFISDAAGNPDLFIQPFSLEKGLIGKPRQLFGAPMSAQASPTFHPRGDRLAFVSNKDGTARIYTLSIEGGQPTLISKKNRDNTSPAWSPDGKKIAYSAMTQGVRQIWIYDFETKEESQLTAGKSHKENPCWAPDSLHLLYNSSTQNTAELFLINLNQKQAIQITDGPGEKRFPSWGPSEINM
jgi:TolB protein